MPDAFADSPFSESVCLKDQAGRLTVESASRQALRDSLSDWTEAHREETDTALRAALPHDADVKCVTLPGQRLTWMSLVPPVVKIAGDVLKREVFVSSREEVSPIAV